MSTNMGVNEELFPWESEAEAAARRRREAGEDAAGEDAIDADPPGGTTAAADGGGSGEGPAVNASDAEAAALGEGGAAVDGSDVETADSDVESDDDAFEAARARAELDFAPRPAPEPELPAEPDGEPQPASAPAPRERRIAPREYYAISEVCEITGLKPHVLRYWEAQFPLLNPSKNRSGNRVYQRKEIRLILLVKELLYEEKYTVEGAKAKLEQLRGGGELGQATGNALDRHMIQVLRSDLRRLEELLTPPRA